MKVKMKYLILFILLFIFFPQTSQADIYKFVDEQGVIHFTNAPTDRRYQVVVKEEKRVETKTPPKPPEEKIEKIIKEVAQKYKVDPALIKAIIKVESDFDGSATSRKGAQGLMQLMPETAEKMKVYRPYHLQENIEGGTKYLKYLLELFRNNYYLALAAYNAGENAVLRYGEIPPYEETKNYVQRVLEYFKIFTERF